MWSVSVTLTKPVMDFLCLIWPSPAETGLSGLPSGPDGVTQRSSLYKETPDPGPLPVGVPSKLLLYYKAPTA